MGVRDFDRFTERLLERLGRLDDECDDFDFLLFFDFLDDRPSLVGDRSRDLSSRDSLESLK